MLSHLSSLLLAVGFVGLAACSEVSTEPAPLLATTQVSPLASATSAAEHTYILEQTVRARPSSGRARALKRGTTWTEFGTITQGTVYRPLDMALVVEGFDVSEAYIVVRDGNVVGFWLPVQKAFDAVEEPKPIVMKQRGED
jgi:hypothetical protein